MCERSRRGLRGGKWRRAGRDTKERKHKDEAERNLRQRYHGEMKTPQRVREGVPLILKQDVNNGKKWLNLITDSQPRVFLSPGVSHHYLPSFSKFRPRFKGR